MKFKLLDPYRDGKGVEKGEDTTPNIRYFFKSIWRKFSKLISINFLLIFQYLPLLGAILAYFWVEKTPTFTSLNYPLLYGMAQFSGDPSEFILAISSSRQLHIPVISLRVILTIAAFLLLYILWNGIFNVGITYLMREMVRGNSVFLFSDFKYAVKKNFKQGFLLGIFDAILQGVFVFDFMNMPDSGILYFLIYGIAILYFFMRFYLYLMLITFDMKISKMFKNALIFTVLGLKRNLLAVLWIIVMAVLNFLLFLLYMPLGIALPAIYFLSFSTFTTTYAAYPIIKQYMIDPYATAEDKTVEENE